MKKFFVDGFVFTKNLDGALLIEFKVGQIVHTFKINPVVAKRMAEILQEYYLNEVKH